MRSRLPWRGAAAAVQSRHTRRKEKVASVAYVPAAAFLADPRLRRSAARRFFLGMQRGTRLYGRSTRTRERACTGRLPGASNSVAWPTARAKRRERCRRTFAGLRRGMRVAEGTTLNEPLMRRPHSVGAGSDDLSFLPSSVAGIYIRNDCIATI